MKVDTATQIEPKKFDDDIYNYPVVRDYFDFGINLQAPPETHTGRARVRELNTASWHHKMAFLQEINSFTFYEKFDASA